MEQEPGRQTAEAQKPAEHRLEEAATEISDQPSDLEINEVAKRLLRWKFLLSALEVHTELCERGRELPLLRDFFSNPGNFETNARYDGISISGIRRSASNLTLDSIDDLSRYSDDGGRDNDERVVVLEFELRRAKETIKELRENLTEYAQENEASLTKAQEEAKVSTSEEDAVKPFELRALNYLTNEYLLKNEYRLTAVTFGEEVGDQDIDDWDDVGVNTPRPPNLLHLFRDYGKHVMEPVEKDKEEIEKLKEQIWQLEMQIKDLNEKIQSLEKENDDLGKKLRESDSLATQDACEVTELNKDRKSIDSISTPVHLSQTVLDEEHDESEAKESAEPKRETVPEIIIEGHVDSQINVQEEYESTLVAKETDHEIIVPRSEQTDGYDVSSNDECASTEDQLEVDQVMSDDQSVDSFKNLDRDDEATQKETVDSEGLQLNCSSKRQTSAAFLQILYGLVQGKTDTRLMKEILRASEDEDAIQIVSRCLPNVIPNVLLNKREELIPIILCMVRLHPDVKVRDSLLHMLFNLIKRPDDEQRRMIIDGCVAFAKKVGATRIESELLPQCWEQITHKYPERRLLVAETCGCMAPYIPAELLSSLMFSMLRQMLEDDRNDKVREAATKSLALILAFVDDKAKYGQAVDLLMKTLMDDSECVSNASREMLLPVIGIWTLELRNLDSQLLTPFFKTVQSILQNASMKMASEPMEDNSQALKLLDLQFKLVFGCCIDLIPLLFAYVLLTAPFNLDDCNFRMELKENRLPPQQNMLLSTEVIIGDDRRLGIAINQFDNYFENHDSESWESLDWVCEQCLSQITEFTGLQRSADVDVMKQLVCFLCKLCRIFGKSFTYKKIIPHFEKLMRASELPFLEDSAPPISSPLLPLFICGVLAVFTEEEDRKRMCTFLKQSLVTIPTQNLSLENLKLCFHILSSTEELQGDLIQVLREALVHPSTGVRIATAPLLEILVRCVKSNSLFSQVASALITLSNDREFVVKVATVPALGSVVETRTDKSLLEKICLQLQSLMDDPGLKDNTELQKTLLRTFSRIIPNSEPKFREEFLIQRLRKMAEHNSFIPDLRVQVEMARELIQVLSSLMCCFIPAELISTQIVPTLRYLERDLKELAPELYDLVKNLITDAENRVANDNASDGSGSSFGREEMKNKLLSGFNRLKDASSKKRDLFKKKDRSSTLH